MSQVFWIDEYSPDNCFLEVNGKEVIMERCPISGKFLPKPIKVGDKVVNLMPTQYDLTNMRAYTVIATRSSLEGNQKSISSNKLKSDMEFIVIDDAGDRRWGTLHQSSLTKWEKLPK